MVPPNLFADHHPHPHRTPEGRAEVLVRVAADSFADALRAAAGLAARPGPASVLGVHVLTADEVDRRHPSPPERYGTRSEGR